MPHSTLYPHPTVYSSYCPTQQYQTQMISNTSSKHRRSQTLVQNTSDLNSGNRLTQSHQINYIHSCYTLSKFPAFCFLKTKQNQVTNHISLHLMYIVYQPFTHH